MKLIQARVPEVEFQILQRRARREGKPMQEIIREALRKHLLEDAVDPKDALFRTFPLFRSRDGRRARISERHDDVLYGESQ